MDFILHYFILFIIIFILIFGFLEFGFFEILYIKKLEKSALGTSRVVKKSRLSSHDSTEESYRVLRSKWFKIGKLGCNCLYFIYYSIVALTGDEPNFKGKYFYCSVWVSRFIDELPFKIGKVCY